MTTKFRLQLLAVASAVCLANESVSADDMARAAPEDVGMTQAGLDGLAQSMRALVDDGKRAGVVWGVMKDGKVVALEAYGQRDIEKNLPMETDTVFRIYSQTRAVTAVAILTLMDEGKLSLDDEVGTYLPEIGAMQVIDETARDRIIATVPQDPPMTIGHLFSYTSGLGYAFHWPASLGMDQLDILDISAPIATSIEKLSRYPLLAQPGEEWIYGFHSDVLGRVAEVISGQPFDAFLHERLLDRIGLDDTGFWTKPGDADRIATVYRLDENGALVPTTSLPLSTYTEPGPLFSAGGGLVSTVPDYLRFGQLLANGGEIDGVRILKEETVKLMGTNRLGPAQLPISFAQGLNPPKLQGGYGWGLAISVRLEDGIHAVPGTTGDLAWAGLADTQYFIDPAKNIVAVAMTQWLGDDNVELGFRLREGVYGALAD